MTPLRTLAFGDESVWGVAWDSDPAGGSLAALGADADPVVLSGAGLADAGSDPGDQWRLEGDGVALVVSAAGELVDVRAAPDGIEGWEQLCRVSGSFEQDGRRHEVDCLGLRTAWPAGVDLGKFESVRAVSAWFHPAEGMSVMAFRPRKAKAHDGDLLAAAVIAPEGSPPVEDPRLSTTYAGDGWPARAGLELWLEGEEPDQQYPRRASGEARGARARGLAGDLEFQVEPFRWHSRGREGAGMYLLARRR
jgi:hypothetical protein